MISGFPRIFIAAVALLAVPAVALAHTGAGAGHGFAHGFGHPFSGLDHIAAMVLVGALAWQTGGAARWLLLATFLLLMAAGGKLGLSGIDLPMAETGIAASVLGLGLMLGLSLNAPLLPALPLVAAGAVFHGYAHGLDMPDTVGGLDYALGFLSATTLLHLIGLAAGMFLTRLGHRSGMPLLRAAGGLAALLGLGLLTSAV